MVPATEEAADDEASPLSERQLAELSQAVRLAKPLRNAAATAKASATCTLVIGALALPFSLLPPSASGLFVSVGLLIVGAIEYRSQRRIKLADAAVCKKLATNQLAMLGIITIYCIWQMLAFSPETAREWALSPEFRQQLGGMPQMSSSIDKQIDQWAPLFVYGLYGSVIFGSVLFQGGMAWYYRSRRAAMDAYNRQAPAWARRVMEIAGR